jgi:hypothetical protein
MSADVDHPPQSPISETELPLTGATLFSFAA